MLFGSRRHIEQNLLVHALLLRGFPKSSHSRGIAQPRLEKSAEGPTKIKAPNAGASAASRSCHNWGRPIVKLGVIVFDTLSQVCSQDRQCVSCSHASQITTDFQVASLHMYLPGPAGPVSALISRSASVVAQDFQLPWRHRKVVAACPTASGTCPWHNWTMPKKKQPMSKFKAGEMCPFLLQYILQESAGLLQLEQWSLNFQTMAISHNLMQPKGSMLCLSPWRVYPRPRIPLLAV